jgi:tetratricopeptide (TPR) repeat protein
MLRARLWLIVLLAGAVQTGCNGVQTEPRTYLAQAEAAYKSRQYGQAVSLLTRCISAKPDSALLARAHYVRALALARSGQRDRARADLERCLKIATDNDIRWRAYTVLGTLNFEDGDWDGAGRAYGAAIDIGPQAPPMDVLLFRLGQCYERVGRWMQARRPYQRILEEYPQSSLVPQARRRLALGADHFAVQCGVFSDRRNAQALCEELRRAGFSPQIRTETRSGRYGESAAAGTVYVVLVGEFATYEEAERELARVKGYVPAAVIWP